jgi:monovalent cation/hydrogen antiporter
MENLHPTLAIVLGLLAIVAAVAVLARRLAISYPILLLCAGLICSLLPQIPDIQLRPNIVFYVFLPPLLYSAAWQTSWREFRFHLVSISMLAVGLVFFTAVGVALTAHWFLPGFDWRLGFLLGAIASPTDAVAATSIARRMGLPHTIVDILEGESLVNDATGLLALQFGIAMLNDGATPAPGHALLEFVWLVGGGVLIGLAVGWVVFYLERLVDEGPVEIALSLIVAYLSYIAGEAAHASGVISVVVCGLYLSRKSSTFFSPEARLQTLAFWDALEFLLNGLVFLLIGFQLSFVLAAIHGYSIPRLCFYGLGFSATLIALRLLWMFPASRIAFGIRTRLLHQHYPRPSGKTVFVLGWTGMRGVVALAAAGSLPFTLAGGRPFPQRGVILFLTFAVILITLVVQGLTLPAVVRALGFQQDLQPQCEEAEARRLLLQASIDLLESRQEQAPPDGQHAIADLLHTFRHRLSDVQDRPRPESQNLSVYELLADIYARQREQLNDLRADDRVGDGVYRTLERELDLDQSRLRHRV